MYQCFLDRSMCNQVCNFKCNYTALCRFTKLMKQQVCHDMLTVEKVLQRLKHVALASIATSCTDLIFPHYSIFNLLLVSIMSHNIFLYRICSTTFTVPFFVPLTSPYY